MKTYYRMCPEWMCSKPKAPVILLSSAVPPRPVKDHPRMMGNCPHPSPHASSRAQDSLEYLLLLRLSNAAHGLGEGLEYVETGKAWGAGSPHRHWIRLSRCAELERGACTLLRNLLAPDLGSRGTPNTFIGFLEWILEEFCLSLSLGPGEG